MVVVVAAEQGGREGGLRVRRRRSGSSSSSSRRQEEDLFKSVSRVEHCFAFFFASSQEVLSLSFLVQNTCLPGLQYGGLSVGWRFSIRSSSSSISFSVYCLT